jgi:hypothetical protein
VLIESQDDLAVASTVEVVFTAQELSVVFVIVQLAVHDRVDIIRTIMKVERDPDLRGLSISNGGRLFTLKSKNKAHTNVAIITGPFTTRIWSTVLNKI